MSTRTHAERTEAAEVTPAGPAPAAAVPRTTAAILAMQRSAGNAATARMLGRESGGGGVLARDGIPTFDTKEEKWATADAPGSAAREGDGRRFGQADASEKRKGEVETALGAVNTIEDVDKLTIEQVRDINPQSTIPYRILKDVLHESWHVAKELLLDPKAPNPDVRRALMTKLWEYRQWHHQEILSEVMEELNKREGDAEALKPSKGAGSATLSSDIDVNLKGNHTELAVPLFNERFRNSTKLPDHAFKNEPGVVYDVNVYAIDFMHKFGSNLQGDKKVTQKEGKRTGREGGGIADEHMQGADRQLQLVTALFKARLFMNIQQWSDYEDLTLSGLPADSRKEQAQAFRDAEDRFSGYLAEMSARMGVKIDQVADQAASGVDQLKAGAKAKAPAKDEHDHAASAEQENILMVAANRIYEEKLATIHDKRAKLKKLIAEFEAAPEEERAAIEQMIDGSLLSLRDLVAESAMYANEASMTDATIHHGVVGIQGGGEIDQQKSEGINAVHEHLADVMKEAGRYGPELGAGAYKAGKYLMRLGDAGKNLGFGSIWGVGVLYDLGRKLSEDIKVRADKGGVDTATESADAVKAIAGRNSLDALLGLAMETAAQINQEYQQERLAHTRAGEADTETAFGHRTAPKKTANANVLNQDMVHPIDRGAENPKKKADLTPGNLGDFSFRLSEAELAKLKEKWAAKR